MQDNIKAPCVKNNNIHITEEQWRYIQKEVIEPLWNISFSSMYYDVKLDYDDFVSMCGWEVDKAIKTFDATKSSLKTFATNVIKRKALTQIRDMKRNKRKADTYAVSIDVPYGDSDVELKYTIVDETSIERVDILGSITNVCNYLRELSSMQKNILICKLLEFGNDEISTGLNIPLKKLNDLINNMKKFEKEQYLRRVNE